MNLQVIRQGNLSGIGAGALCTMEIPRAHIHHALVLRCTGAAGILLNAAQIGADVGAITLRIGGKVKHDNIPASFYLQRDNFWRAKDGAFVTAGDIVIDFTTPNFKSAVERSLLAWGMADVPSFVLEVNITGVAVLTNIEVFSVVEFGSRRLGRHLCIGRHAPSFAATGIHEVTTLPYGDADVGLIVDHITPGAGVLNSVNLKNNQVDLWNTVPVGLNNLLLRRSGRTSIATFYSLDYALINHKDGFMPSAVLNGPRYDIEFTVAGGAPGNYVIYREEVRGMTQAAV